MYTLESAINCNYTIRSTKITCEKQKNDKCLSQRKQKGKKES